MAKDKKSNPDEKRHEDLFHDLHGELDHMTEEDLDRLLSDAGVDVAESQRKVARLADELAAAFRAQNRPAPKFLVNLARAMRGDAPASFADAKRQHEAWAADLGRSTSSGGPVRIVAAARRKGDAELSDADRALLEEQRRLLEGDDDDEQG